MAQLPSDVVVVDLETSGINPFRNEVLAVGLVPLMGDRPRALIYVRHPSIEWNEYARRNFQKFAAAWEAEAVSPTEACGRIEAYLASTFGSARVTPLGHNVGFDLAFLRKLAFQAGRDQIAGLSHRAIDTHTLLYALALKGKIPLASITSDGAFEYFGIKLDDKARHAALGDACATRDLAVQVLGLL